MKRRERVRYAKRDRETERQRERAYMKRSYSGRVMVIPRRRQDGGPERM